MFINGSFQFTDVFVEPSGYLESVNYPNEYPNNHDAKYAICGVESSIIELELQDVFLNEGTDFLLVS